jgi:2-keto-4-pentenoate hydratase/2-oxohepta-3-ene-1,7-dioic acid hydratase in catechol pathway
VRLCRFDQGRLGVVRGTQVHDVTGALDGLPAAVGGSGDTMITDLDVLRDRIESLWPTAPRLDLDRVQLRSPIANPPRVIAVRSNYSGVEQVAAGATAAAPDLFLKAATSVAGPADGIELRLPGRRTDHEVELAVVIGRQVDRVRAAEALDCVAGYCIAIDFTLRGEEDRGLRKSLDGYTMLGPWLTTPDEAGNVADLAISLQVNGVTRQAGNTRDMIFDVPAIVAHACRYFPLRPGDVILTGTPPGAGPVATGDTLRSAISNLGEMSVLVREAGPGVT